MWQTIQSVLQQSWHEFGAQTLRVLPHVLASLLILLLGVILGVVVGRIAHRAFAVAHVDRGAARLGIAASLERLGVTSAATLLSRLLMWVVIFLAFIPALYSLDPALGSGLVERFFLYLPHLVVAAVILAIGTLLSRFLSRSVLIAAVNKEIRPARLLSGLARVGVMLVTIAVVFEHLGIGRTTVLVAFAILFGGATLAAAIAIGLGSQDLVRRFLSERTEAPAAKETQDTIRHW